MLSEKEFLNFLLRELEMLGNMFQAFLSAQPLIQRAGVVVVGTEQYKGHSCVPREGQGGEEDEGEV